MSIDIKVKKPSPITREFLYQGIPVSPEALKDMFPSAGEGTSIDTVNLRTGIFRATTYQDSLWRFFWEKDYQKQRVYRSDFSPQYYAGESGLDSTLATYMSGFAEYTMLGNTTGGKFIVLAALNGGGTFTQAYVFILDITGDKLVRLGLFLVTNIRDYPIEIHGNIITNGPGQYTIPSSAR